MVLAVNLLGDGLRDLFDPAPGRGANMQMHQTAGTDVLLDIRNLETHFYGEVAGGGESFESLMARCIDIAARANREGA